jgi:ribokinase
LTEFDVVGFGALNVDKLFKVNRIAHAEEESFVESVHETCGGSAANTAVGLARLGCRAGFVGKVGEDREGAMQVDEFQREGVDTEGLIHASAGRSGSVMGFVDRQGNRALYINSGVNDSVAFGEVNLEYASDTQFLHLTSFVGKESFQTQKKLVAALPDGIKVSFDPGALYAQRGFEQLEPIIRRVYVMMPNALELEQITGEKDYRKGASFLIGEGVTIVAVKLGCEGCYITDGKDQHQVATLKLDAVDSTGAGDAFCAGFLYGLLKKCSLFDCGRIGNFVASRSVMQMGARAGLPHANDLDLLG